MALQRRSLKNSLPQLTVDKVLDTKIIFKCTKRIKNTIKMVVIIKTKKRTCFL